jgi:hypothetical protein
VTREMPGTIEIGRKGFRGRRAVQPSTHDAVIVDCRGLIDPACLRNDRGKVIRNPNVKKLAWVVEKLLEDQYDETQKLVARVVEGVEAGKLVHVRCLMGKNRSQAVVSLAVKALKEMHAKDPKRGLYEGPHYLGSITPTE